MKSEMKVVQYLYMCKVRCHVAIQIWVTVDFSFGLLVKKRGFSFFLNRFTRFVCSNYSRGGGFFSSSGFENERMKFLANNGLNLRSNILKKDSDFFL